MVVMQRAVLFVHVGISAVMIACGATSGGGASKGSGGTASTENLLGSCDTRTTTGASAGQCRDWIGDSTADFSVSCNGLGGVFSDANACPSDGRVGQCSVGPTLGATAVYNYYAAGYTTSTAEQNCQALDGVFDAGGSAGTGGAGGATGTGGAGGTTTGGTGGGACPPECFRAYECAPTCNDPPVNYGCCPCPEGMVDFISCGQ
jgi:hypothetical protein